jgi:hypothetical protein
LLGDAELPAGVEHGQAVAGVELNRCLDNAIAGAVSSFGSARQVLINDQAETLHQRLQYYALDHQRLVEIALQSYAAIRTGHVGVTGTTGTLLLQTLEDLRSLAERTLPEIRLAYLSGSGLTLQTAQAVCDPSFMPDTQTEGSR